MEKLYEETYDQEDIKHPGTFKSILYAVIMLGGASVIVFIAAILTLMFLSYGDNMWPVLSKLKIGPGP